MIKAVLTTIDNQSTSLGKIIDISLNYSLGSPASGLFIKANVDSPIPNCKAVTLYYEDKMIFFGGIDQWTLGFNSKGGTVEIEARSLGGMALDNEACPATLWGANVSTVFYRHLKKYNLGLISNLPTTTVPVFTIRKGMSDWDVFKEFVRRAYSINPYVNGGTVYLRKPTTSGYRLPFDNEGKSMGKYTSIAKVLAPYNLISKMIVRDEFGEYSSSVSSSIASSYGTIRERYIIPTNEFAEIPRTDASLRLKASLEKLEHYLLELPYLLLPELNQPVELFNTPFGDIVLLVADCSVVVGEKGAKTLLTLVGSI